ncbi:MAG: DNA methyltransferase, partial [Nitrospinota bacterium]
MFNGVKKRIMTTSAIDKSRFNHLIKGFQFAELFNELGWDYVKKTEKVVVHDTEYLLNAVAEKKGFVVFVCTHSSIPDDNIRKKIDNAVTKLYFEHLLIFCDSAKKQQIWQLIIREHGKPVVPRKVYYYSHQEPELLFQKLKGLFFSIDDEDRISIVDVKSAVTGQFSANAEKVTKKFYDGFKKEHTAFLEFINGVTDKVDREWYASLMLNRLMFIYFIQRKGFLDNDKDYLRNRLKTTQEKKGKNKFYSFYRNFLLILFHKGLGSFERTLELESEIGIVTYLNGGLFDVHHIEENYPDIKIEDKAFEGIFDFFDQYEWHLDTRITATGKDINPDVIGYIFEKYINDRAAMGAYYTKEDITDYISKNCVIPFLFDEVKRNYPKALKPDYDVWNMLKEDPDKYIYDAVKHGTQIKNLPPEIEAGTDSVSTRTEWNKPATQEYALPTEIWREVVERRKRYNEIKSKIENGGITEINDFITYNLNIRQFAQDVIENTDDPDLVKHFYKAIRNITVLDPTCGSGAFLFAVLNILEPLYEACIQRMEDYVSESPKGRYKFFEDTLADAKSDKHPNIQYFIYKSIILNNLYGVDIMKEAVETAKLRLFLKLSATVDADYNKPNL